MKTSNLRQAVRKLMFEELKRIETTVHAAIERDENKSPHEGGSGQIQIESNSESFRSKITADIIKSLIRDLNREEDEYSKS